MAVNAAQAGESPSAAASEERFVPPVAGGTVTTAKAVVRESKARAMTSGTSQPRRFGARLCEPQRPGKPEGSLFSPCVSCFAKRCGSQTRAPSVAAPPRCAESQRDSRPHAYRDISHAAVTLANVQTPVCARRAPLWWTFSPCSLLCGPAGLAPGGPAIEENVRIREALLAQTCRQTMAKVAFFAVAIEDDLRLGR